jgi:hypothetical protein
MNVHTSALVALLQLAGLGTGALAETPSGGQIAAGRKFAQMVCGAPVMWWCSNATNLRCRRHPDPASPC